MAIPLFCAVDIAGYIIRTQWTKEKKRITVERDGFGLP